MYQVFETREKNHKQFLAAIGKVFNVKDVLDDAHSTFIRND